MLTFFFGERGDNSITWTPPTIRGKKIFDQVLVSLHIEDEHNKLLDWKKMFKPLKIYSCKSVKI